MRNIFRVVPVAITATCSVLAQSTVAIIHSNAPFLLRGANVSTGQGVPSWPVMAGDTFSAGKAPTTLTFTDGSVIVLAPDSSGSIEMSGDTPVFHLLTGKASYRLKSAAAVILTSPSGVITPVAVAGTIGAKAGVAVGVFTAAHAAAIVGVVVVGATAASLGVVLATSNGTPVSPSQ